MMRLLFNAPMPILTRLRATGTIGFMLTTKGTRTYGIVTVLAMCCLVLLAGAGCNGREVPPEPVSNTAHSELKKAQPAIEWKPSSLAVSLAPGSTQTITVKLTTLENVSATSVRVAAQLAPFLTTTPEHLSPLKKGASAALTLTLTVPSTTKPGVVTGDVSLFKGTGCRRGEPSLCASLPITLNVLDTPTAAVKRLEDAGAIPKLDRGSDLAGPDANGNGIRDDIDAFIAEQSYTSSQRSAVEQLARALQRATAGGAATTGEARAIMQQVQNGADCVLSRFNTATAAAVGRTYEKYTANTEARVRAYLNFDSLLDGTVLTSSGSSSCEN
jgi:hypothetical protein